MQEALLKAAKPLAEYLATLRISNPIHNEVVADLYDMVNEIRDEQIKRAKGNIDALVNSPDFHSSPEKRTSVARLLRIIRLQQGID